MMTTPAYHYQFDHRAYTDAYLLGHVTEGQVQSAIMDLLTAKRIAASVVDAGAARLRGGILRNLRARGVENVGAVFAKTQGAAHAGLVDIVGCLPGGRALFIECKAPAWYRIGRGNALRVVRGAGEPTDDQLAYLDRMYEAGALCLVAWSSVDVENALREVSL